MKNCIIFENDEKYVLRFALRVLAKDYQQSELRGVPALISKEVYDKVDNFIEVLK